MKVANLQAEYDPKQVTTQNLPTRNADAMFELIIYLFKAIFGSKFWGSFSKSQNVPQVDGSLTNKNPYFKRDHLQVFSHRQEFGEQKYEQKE